MSQTPLHPQVTPRESAQPLVLAPEKKRISRIWFARGLTLCSLGRHAEALACYDRALALDAGNAPTWYNKAVTLVTLGRHAEALVAYDRALELAPRHAFLWVQKGLTLSHLKRHAEALVAYDRALELDRHDALAWHNKGATLYRLRRFEEALTAYDQALALESDKAVTRRGISRSVHVEVQAAASGHQTARALPTALAPVLAEVPERPVLAPNVTLIGEMKESGSKQRQWLIQRAGHYIQVTELLFRIAEHADGRHTLAQIAVALSTATGHSVSAGNVRYLMGTCLIPAGLIAWAGGCVDRITQPTGHAAMRSSHEHDAGNRPERETPRR